MKAVILLVTLFASSALFARELETKDLNGCDVSFFQEHYIKKVYMSLNNEATSALLMGQGVAGDEDDGNVGVDSYNDGDTYLIIMREDFEKCKITLVDFNKDSIGLEVALAKFFTTAKEFGLTKGKKLKHLLGTYCGVQASAVVVGGVGIQAFVKKDPTIVLGDLSLGFGLDVGVSRACFKLAVDGYGDRWAKIKELTIGNPNAHNNDMGVQ